MLMCEKNHRFKTIVFYVKPDKKKLKKYKEKGWKTFYRNKKGLIVPI